MFPRSDPPFQGVLNDEGKVVAYVVPVGEYERMRYEMEELQIQQIVAEYRRTGKLPPATEEEGAELVRAMQDAVPFGLDELIAELENGGPNRGG